MKNINWKKYAGAAMAAAMIPALVAPIATEAAGSIAGHTGYNIKITLDGQPANYLFDQKKFELRSTDGQVVVTIENQGYFWVTPHKTYDIYDVTDGTQIYKGTIKVGSNSGNFVTMEYKTEYETKTVKAADVDLTNNSNAYHLDNSGTGIYTDSVNAKLIVGGKETGFQKSITAHAPAIIEYDLTGKNFSHFTSYVGLDARRDFGALQVDVYVDNKLYDSFVQNRNDEAKLLNIDLKNNQTLKFVVTGKTETNIPNQNPNQNAMVVFGDAEFVQKVKVIK